MHMYAQMVIIVHLYVHMYVMFFLHAIAIASPLTLLIGYYHGVLLRDINAESLFDDMCSKHLLSGNDQSLISAGHSVHHRNWLLLEHVRHMNTEAFLAFCKLMQRLSLAVGSQLITGMLHTYEYTMCTNIYYLLI